MDQANFGPEFHRGRVDIARFADIMDESRDAVFLLAEIHRREQDLDVELNVFVSKFLKIWLDEQTIRSHMLEPFQYPQAQAFVAVSLQHDLAVLQRIPRPPAHPK